MHTGMAQIQNPDDRECWWGCRTTGTLTHCCWESKMAQPLWMTTGQLLIKVNMMLPQGPEMDLHIYPKDFRTYVHTQTCPRMFVAATFLMARTGMQPWCPSVGDWGNKWWSIQTREYHSTLLERNAWPSLEETWRKLQCVVLSEKPVWKCYSLEDSNPVILSKGQNYRHRRKIDGCQGVREVRIKR